MIVWRGSGCEYWAGRLVHVCRVASCHHRHHNGALGYSRARSARGTVRLPALFGASLPVPLPAGEHPLYRCGHLCSRLGARVRDPVVARQHDGLSGGQIGPAPEHLLPALFGVYAGIPERILDEALELRGVAVLGGRELRYDKFARLLVGNRVVRQVAALSAVLFVPPPVGIRHALPRAVGGQDERPAVVADDGRAVPGVPAQAVDAPAQGRVVRRGVPAVYYVRHALDAPESGVRGIAYECEVLDLRVGVLVRAPELAGVGGLKRPRLLVVGHRAHHLLAHGNVLGVRLGRRQFWADPSRGHCPPSPRPNTFPSVTFFTLGGQIF